MKKNLLVVLAAFILLTPQIAIATEINWAGIKWEVRAGTGNPCTTGLWNDRDVWVDRNGWLHLKIAKLPSGKFACEEITSVKRFGFGQYEVQVEGPIGAVDKNVVLGIFMYPPKDVGPDGTNELDIEIARWGHATAPQVNYTAWFRSRKGNRHTSVQVPDDLTEATFRMIWQPGQVRWESSLPGTKSFSLEGDIAEQPQLLKINLWLFKSPYPSHRQEVEFIIKSLRFT
jgi:hypothetical protein